MKKGRKSAYIREILQDYPKICAKPPDQRTRNEQRRFETVNALLDTVDHMEDARDKRKFIDMVYFRQSHNIQGAALCIPVGKRTVERWNSQILGAVDEIMNLM